MATENYTFKHNFQLISRLYLIGVVNNLYFTVSLVF